MLTFPSTPAFYTRSMSISAVKRVLFSVVLFIASVAVVVPFVQATDQPAIYFFYGNGCPHCSVVEEYFEKEDMYSRYPIQKREIYFDRDNAALFEILLKRAGYEGSAGVPTVIMGTTVIQGDKPIINAFVREADFYLQNGPETGETEISTKSGFDLTIPAVIIGALVDAINPCEFAVLIILMTTILATGDAKKAFRAGLAFSTSIFISYFLMGLELYKALAFGGISARAYTLIGWIAILLGLANLKDYFWYGKGFLMEVPMSWRPKLKSLIHSVTNPTGAFFVGFIVSLFLLPCTSGPYIVILGMLARNAFDAQAVLYLVLYNLIFISPMVAISWAVYHGFKPERAEAIRQKRLKLLHLIAGVVMLVMGTVILMGWV